MLEKDLWEKIRDNPLNLNMFFQRIESSTAEGIPDLYWVSNGISGWCELKYLPETATGKYNLSLDKYSLLQRNWNSTQVRAGGITLLCVGVGSRVYWLQGNKAVTILRFSEKEISNWAIHEGIDFPIKKLTISPSK